MLTLLWDSSDSPDDCWLAVGCAFAWFYLKAAANVKVPPSK